jgi:competence protein ComEC
VLNHQHILTFIFIGSLLFGLTLKEITQSLKIIGLGFFVLGLLQFGADYQQKQFNPLNYFKENSWAKITAQINSDITHRDTYDSFEIEINHINGKRLQTPARVLITNSPNSNRQKTILEYSDTIEFESYLSAVPPDFRERLNKQGVYLSFILNDEVKRIKSSMNPWHLFKKNCFTLKNILIPFHIKSLPDPYQNLLIGLLFGTSVASLPAEKSELYRKAGVIHLLVVSGSQIALLVGTLQSIAGIFKMSPLLSFIFCTVINIGFTIATGADPSILRACVMAQSGLVAVFLNQKRNAFSILLLSAWVLNLMDPTLIYSVSFQLSFAATFALLFVVPIVESRLQKYFSEKLAGMLATTMGPILITSPLSMFYFSGFSLIGIPLNFLVQGGIELLVLLGFLSTLIGNIFYPLGYLINQTNLAGIWLLDTVVSFCAVLPYSYINIISPTLALVLLSYGFIGFYLGKLMIKNNLKLFGLIFCFLLLWHQADTFSNERVFTSTSNELVITAIDVGQGDAILIETPDHKKILIDGGPVNDKTINFIKKKGINYLDAIILTHAHLDHFGGLPKVIKEINCGLILNTAYHNNNPVYQRFLEAIKKQKIPIEDVWSHKSFELSSSVSINFLHPSNPLITDAKSIENENSSVLYLTYQNFSAIFMGDAGEPSEKRILRNNPDLKVTLLKAGHHGSRHSSSMDFLKQIKPELTFISCAVGNRYKHPHTEALKRFEEIQTKVYRTDLQGNLMLTTDGQTYRVMTEKSGP